MKVKNEKPDINWLIGRAKSIVDGTLTYFQSNLQIVGVSSFIFGIFITFMFLSSDGIFLPFFAFPAMYFIIGALLLAQSHPKIKWLKPEKIAKCYEWKAFFDRHGKLKGPDRVRKLEHVMMVVDNIEGWLKLNRDYQTNYISFLFIVSSIATIFTGLLFDEGFHTFILIASILLVTAAVVAVIPTLILWSRMKYWRPILKTYKKRLSTFPEGL